MDCVCVCVCVCVTQGQKWTSDPLTKQSKPSLGKSSSKLFFVSRLRGKKHKAGGSSKVLQDTSNTQDASLQPTQGPHKVGPACSPHRAHTR